MPNKNLFKNFTIGSFILVAISLVILAFGKIDYNISLLLQNRESLWAQFFYVFGEQPAYWGLLVGTVILFSVHKKTNRVWQIFCLITGFFFSFLCVYVILIIPLRYIYDIIKSPISRNIKATVAAVASLISICITAAAPKYEPKLKKFRKHAIFLILVIISEMLLVSIMKDIWGRPRMRSISGFDEFRYWFEIAGPADNQEYKSFPSGHSANSFTMVAFYVFAPYYKRIRPKLFFVLAVVWGSLVAISRVALAAHFLSDVIAGFFVTIVCIYYYYTLLFNKRK